MSSSPSAKLALGPTALALALAYLLVVVPAEAEQSARGGVRVSFRGSFSPNHVPRRGFAPVYLTLEGSARGSDGSTPPRLRRIEFAFGARGGLDTRGLPVCARAELQNATQRQALERCRGALVGRGELSAEVPFSRERPYGARAAVLVFNGLSRGRPAAWVHAYAASPPVSFVLPFLLRRPAKGTYGVTMRSLVGRALGAWPRLSSFRIALGRRYSAAGRAHSYLSARCPLAPSLTGASVPFARATYEFAPRPAISLPIRRRCVVRE